MRTIQSVQAAAKGSEAEARSLDPMVRLMALAMLIVAWAVAAMIVAGLI